MAESSAATGDSGADGAGTSIPLDGNQNESTVAASTDSTNDPLALDKPKAKAGKKEPLDTDVWDLDGEKLTRAEYKQLRDIQKRQAELEQGSRKKFMEAAEQRKAIAAEREQMKQLLEQAKKDPWALLEHIGVNPDEVAEQRITKQLQRAQMTPEQIEAEQMRTELEEMRAWKAEQEKTAQEQKHQALTNQFVQQFDQSIAQSLTTEGLPRNHKTVARMTDILLSFHEADMPIDASMAAKIVRDELQSDIQETFAALVKSNPKVAMDLLGPDGIKAITDARVATVTGEKRQPPQVPQAPINQPKPKAPKTFEEVRKELKLKF